MRGEYEKRISVYGERGEEGGEKVRIIVCDREVMEFCEDDFD